MARQRVIEYLLERLRDENDRVARCVLSIILSTDIDLGRRVTDRERRIIDRAIELCREVTET